MRFKYFTTETRRSPAAWFKIKYIITGHVNMGLQRAGLQKLNHRAKSISASKPKWAAAGSIFKEQYRGVSSFADNRNFIQKTA